MTLAEFSSLVTLFAATFGAATVLPFQSELIFAGMQAAGAAPLWLLITVASIGNTLGSVVNWWMGRFVERWKGSRWFPVSAAQLARGQRWYLKYGVWTLLLSWAPLGDVFTVAAGVMRTPFWLFLALVALAKTGRFLALAWLLG